MRVLLITAVMLTILSAFRGPAIENSKVIILKIDGAGLVSDGIDTISSDDLADYISERLIKSYMGTGKMYDKIKVEKVNGEPASVAMEVLLKEIAKGQKKALTELCLHKYSKGFDSLKTKQQAKIRRLYPVLFQNEYS